MALFFQKAPTLWRYFSKIANYIEICNLLTIKVTAVPRRKVLFILYLLSYYLEIYIDKKCYAQKGQTMWKSRIKRHIIRMNQMRWPSILQNWKRAGIWPAWRPKQWWMDKIEKDLKRARISFNLLYGITTGCNRVRFEELVGDRERWKDITAASMSRQI